MNKHKGVKVYWNGKPLRNVYPHATRWQMFKYKVRMIIRFIMFWTIVLSAIYGVFRLGGYMNPSTIVTKAEVIKEVEMQAPILDRIAKCESPTGHWKKGQVSLNANTNQSVDIGKYQINNQAWGAKATELGLNLMVESDNEAMAKWIYANRGTQDWYSSKACWMK